MKNEFTTQAKILKLLGDSDRGATSLAKELGVSKQIVHRYLKELYNLNFILKIGEAPLAKYRLNQDKPFTRIYSDYIYTKDKILPLLIAKYSGYEFTGWSKHESSLDFMLKSSAVYSSNIEGVAISLNSFMKEGRQARKKDSKEVTEVTDLLNAYNFAKRHKLNEKNLLEAHGYLSRNLLTPSRQGRYRKEPIGVFGQKGLVYLSIEDILVKNEMDEFFAIIKRILEEKLSLVEKVFWASWIHLALAIIHPFSDGNGRIARLLEKWFLAEVLDKEVWFLQTEKFYFDNRDKYYNNLKLGVNYWEVKYEKGEKFLEMLLAVNMY